MCAGKIPVCIPSICLACSEPVLASLGPDFSPSRLPNDGLTFPPRPGVQRHSQRELRTHLLAKHFTSLRAPPPPFSPLASDLSGALQERSKFKVLRTGLICDIYRLCFESSKTIHIRYLLNLILLLLRSMNKYIFTA